MRIQILSDLHLEFARFIPPDVHADITILAGDIDTGTKGLQWALKTFPNNPVLYVLGNHEFYGHAIPSLTKKLQQLAEGTNVHVLENQSFALGDTTFFGASLWTDFELNGTPLESMTTAKLEMTDFRRIRKSPSYARFSPKDARFLHHQTREWLQKSLTTAVGKKIVITHHAPLRQSTRNPARNPSSPHPLDPAYASDMETLIEAPKLANDN